MSGIHEQDAANTFQGLVQTRPELRLEELGLGLDVGFGGDGADFTVAEVESFFKK